jgi:hypothetical protein
MRLLPRVQTSLSFSKTSASGSSGTLSAVSVGTQDASPSSLYLATFSSVSQSSSVGPLSLLSSLGFDSLSCLSALPLLCCQHPDITLGLLIHPPVRLCSRLFDFSVHPSCRDSTLFGWIRKLTNSSVLGGTPCKEIEFGDKLHYGVPYPSDSAYTTSHLTPPSPYVNQPSAPLTPDKPS